MKKQDWCVINYAKQPPVLECKHCGATEEMHLPARIPVLLALFKSFSAEHRYCKPEEGKVNDRTNGTADTTAG